mgnify:CR=1
MGQKWGKSDLIKHFIVGQKLLRIARKSSYFYEVRGFLKITQFYPDKNSRGKVKAFLSSYLV